jgi:hypothetical protein
LVQYPVISSSTRCKSFSHDAHFQPITFSLLKVIIDYFLPGE